MIDEFSTARPGDWPDAYTDEELAMMGKIESAEEHDSTPSDGDQIYLEGEDDPDADNKLMQIKEDKPGEILE